MLCTCPECGHQISHEARRCPNCNLPDAGWRSQEWQTLIAKRKAERCQAAVGRIIRNVSTETGGYDSLPSYHGCKVGASSLAIWWKGGIERKYIDLQITQIVLGGYDTIKGTMLCCGEPMSISSISLDSPNHVRAYFAGEDAPTPKWMK